MRSIALLGVVVALALSLAVRSADSAVRTANCTIAELEVLQLLPNIRSLPVHDGWVSLDAWNAAKAKACRMVAARFAWTNRSFPRSTRFVDRLYPGMGHGSWADACASSEGGHGPWVPNHEGSGAGGWLQFKSGTFYGVIDEAIWRARSVGVRIPSYARSWYSPLGQAIAASEMLFRGRSSEWTGSTC